MILPKSCYYENVRVVQGEFILGNLNMCLNNYCFTCKMVTTLQVSLFKIYLFICAVQFSKEKKIGWSSFGGGGGGAEVNGNMKPGWQTNL